MLPRLEAVMAPIEGWMISAAVEGGALPRRLCWEIVVVCDPNFLCWHCILT